MSIASELAKLVQIFKNWAPIPTPTPTPTPDPYVLPPATADTLGGVKVGNGLEVTEDGTLSATGGTPDPYILPPATTETLGGVKIGNGLSIQPDGTLNASGGGDDSFLKVMFEVDADVQSGAMTVSSSHTLEQILAAFDDNKTPVAFVHMTITIAPHQHNYYASVEFHIDDEGVATCFVHSMLIEEPPVSVRFFTYKIENRGSGWTVSVNTIALQAQADS